MKYFAYGSNMSLKRLRERVPGARSLGVFSLKEPELRFHKFSSVDGSGKCDACFTGKQSSCVLGVLYEIDPVEKERLDQAEGLGFGYEEKEVYVCNARGEQKQAFLYFATEIDASLQPYTWYLEHVLTGAREANLPPEYIARIQAVRAVQDFNKEREAQELALYNLNPAC